ncbi:4-coumarate--CoA ligase-like 9 [Hibiscus syriacus]|uniref:4-coumarate--CoA ligase-like 9 n=1 Tax=Hibiscus syriacus TaxID=106335 RepID=A0A6A3CD33_HIBSY|nr:4-coumarate--CoA ligase-like 9 [Hibiscus syriacus]KAE8727103.1 4-coumarate--CoA ligase-like 9 [Hibiscus syriacus]
MAERNHSRQMDPKTGFCYETGTYSSLRPRIPLPSPDQPLSVAEFCLSIFSSTSTDGATAFAVNANTGRTLTYSQFVSQVRSLAHCLKKRYSISQNDVAFVLCPSSLHVPVIYFALLSLGIIVSPANPLSSKSEIAHQIRLSRPVIAFATSQSSHKIPSLKHGTILLDSPEFLSFLTRSDIDDEITERVKIKQSDMAAVLYSSGTTGRVKGVIMTHRNLIAMMAMIHHYNTIEAAGSNNRPRPVTFFTVPLFHVFGFFSLLGTVLSAETVVLTERFEFTVMLRAIEKYKVTVMPVSPPLVLSFVKSDLTKKYDLSSLQAVGCGGAPLGHEIAQLFNKKFPNVLLLQGYGLTETGGGGATTEGHEEVAQRGTVGRLAENIEAKIVDSVTGESLPPGQRGELWLRGPVVTKGYIGDEKATAETLDSEGWLKTGDICYFDSEGFLYVVDRLKELIKYKAYQVPPAELEQLLHSHPEISDAAVIPYPDEAAGQIPMAYVVRNPPGSSLTEAQVMDFIAQQVAPYKKIRRVAFIDSIPKSAAGKILRRELVNHSTSGGLSRL